MSHLQEWMTFITSPTNLSIITFCIMGFYITYMGTKQKKLPYQYFTYEYEGNKYCGLKNYYISIEFKEYKNIEFFSDITSFKFKKTNDKLLCILNDEDDKQHFLIVNKITRLNNK